MTLSCRQPSAIPLLHVQYSRHVLTSRKNRIRGSSSPLCEVKAEAQRVFPLSRFSPAFKLPTFPVVPRYGPQDWFPQHLHVCRWPGCVMKETLQCATWGCHYRVNNGLDQKYRPLPEDEIVCPAEKMVGGEKTDAVIFDNSNGLSPI